MTPALLSQWKVVGHTRVQHDSFLFGQDLRREVTDPNTGVVTVESLFAPINGMYRQLYRSRSKYTPHQGIQERNRRASWN